MKLYPLLFLNEGQDIFGSNAISQGFACLKIPDRDMIVMFHPTKFMEAYNSDNMNNMALALRGYMEYRDYDIVQVSWSCAEKGWGPLMYQTLLKLVEPKWIMSDESVSKNASNVYNAMYKLEDLYDRKWIGDLSSREECLQTDIFPQLKNYPNDEIENEEQFLSYLESKNVKPYQVGCFWAYKKKSHEGAIAKMLAAGNMFAKQQKSDVIEKLIEAASTFNDMQQCRTR